MSRAPAAATDMPKPYPVAAWPELSDTAWAQLAGAVQVHAPATSRTVHAPARTPAIDHVPVVTAPAGSPGSSVPLPS